MFYGLKQRNQKIDFLEVYTRFREPILRYITSCVAMSGVAEELTQDVFLKVHRFQDQYDMGFCFSTWLWTIAKNTVTDYLRGTAKNLTIDSVDICFGLTGAELMCTLPNAEEIIFVKSQRKNLFKMMKKLTRSQKRVLWLSIVHELSYVEIAGRLDLSISAVKNLAYRARIALTSDPAIFA